jgi:hypothetical protein
MRWRTYDEPSIFVIDATRCAPAHREGEAAEALRASGGFSLRGLREADEKARQAGAGSFACSGLLWLGPSVRLQPAVLIWARLPQSTAHQDATAPEARR